MKSYKISSVADNAITLLIVIVVMAVFVLGLFWMIWSLWSFVLGQVWPSGPSAIVSPSYKLFICEWILLGMIGRRIFGHSKKGD